ncbi:MAG: hypothetical protein ACOYXU_14455 [Nitrospirota bacterium]
MKRHLVFGTVLAALIGVTAAPSWALDVKWGGDYRLRGFYADNLTDQDDDSQDSIAYMNSRFLLTSAVTEDGVSGVVTFIAGQTNGNGNRLLGGDPGAPPSGVYGPEASSTVGLLEAYLAADFKTWSAKGGRSVYKLGNGIILDDSVDGLWASFPVGGMDLTVGSLKLIEQTDSFVGIGNSGPGTAGDADLYVVDLGLGKMMGDGHTGGVFLAYLTDRDANLFGGGAAIEDDATLWLLGLTGGMTAGGVQLKGELDYMTGEQNIGGTKTDLGGYNLMLGAKLNAGAMPVGVDLIYTSGDDPSSTSERNVNGLNGNYPVGILLTNVGAVSGDTKDGTCLSPDGGALGGSSGCIDGSGLTAIKISTGMVHGPHTIDLAAIYAMSTEEPVAGGDTDLGIELDATISMAMTKRLNVLAGLGYLLPGDYWKMGVSTAPTDSMMVGVLQASYSF